MKKQLHLMISGKVQGVFFRSESREKAYELGITGWVRNAPTGKVEIVAQGKEDELQKFVAWCHKGPPAAVVEGVSVKWENVEEEFVEFEIRY